MCKHAPEIQTQGTSVNLPHSITGKLFGVVVVRLVGPHRAPTPGEEVGAQQAEEISQDHDIHGYHGGEEV